MSQTNVAEVNVAIAANLRAEAARVRGRQGDLAQLLGISSAQMSQRMNGRVPLSIGEVVVIAAHLCVPLARLLEGVTAPEAVSV